MKKFMNYFPMMEPAEVALMEKYLQPDDVLLEWGSGNSTVYFSQFVNQIYSIEHEKYWFHEVSEKLKKAGVDNYTLVLNPLYTHQDINDYLTIWKHMPSFSKFLIDGRKRVRCAKALLDEIDENVLVFLHDWQREYYKPVLEWYDVVEEITDFPGMVVLRKKAGL